VVNYAKRYARDTQRRHRHFADATIASAFVARWCAGHRAASLDGLFQIREDEPKKRVPQKGHKTP